MNTGTNISITAHAGLLLWALIGGWFLQASDPIEFSSTEVSLFSSEEFQALLPQTPVPSAQQNVSILNPVVPEEEAPVVEPQQTDSRPETVVEDISQNAPVLPPDMPKIDDVAAEPPAIEQVTPVPDAPAAEDTQIVNEEFAPESTPFAAQKIESLPTPQPEQDAPVAETTTPELAPEDTAEAVAEPEPATVQEQTTSEIVTEAEKPASSVMQASVRPMLRPTPKAAVEPKVEETSKPQENEPDPIAAALAQATVETPEAATPLPIGSRLSSGEEDAFRLAVKRCWNLGTASTEVLSTKITVALSMSREGKPDVGSIRLLSSTGGSESSAATAFRMAKSALVRCGSSGYNLPSDKYDQWQNIEITFNPENMRTK